MSAEMLKLRAKDAEDIEVISAVLQDSIVPVCDMAFQQETKSFIVVAQRLRREGPGDEATERICCALTINGVVSVQTHGIDLHHHERMLDLLAIMPDSTQKSLSLIFAGDARIRLALESWGAVVEDFGASWPALCHPHHEDLLSERSSSDTARNAS